MKQTIICACFAMTLFVLSCEKSTPLTVEPSEIVLYTDGTQQINAEPSDGVKYTSDDDYYASVDANGLVTANKVGKTNIRVSSSNGDATIPVVILPKYSLYPELDPVINSPVSTLKNVLGSNYSSSYSSTGELLYSYENYNTYTTEIIATISNNKCTGVGVLVPTSNMSMLIKYLTERYTIAGMLNDYYLFMNHDENVVISLTLYNISFLMVMYLPY